MRKAPASFKYGLIAAMTLILAFSFAPAPVWAGTCTCANGDVTDVSSQAACTSACGTSGNVKNYTDAVSPTTTPATGTNVTLENPLSFCGKGASALSGQKCVQLIIGNVIKAALGIVGSIALLMVMWGGFRWLTAMGNSEKVEKGKEILIWATLGLVVIFGAYAITSYVITALTGSK